MEEKRREAGSLPAATSSAGVGVESPASEPASSRRRAGGQKRKATALSAGNTSSTPSKRITRDKNSNSHTPIYNHNGPLTRARQGPSSLSASAGGTALAGGKLEGARDDLKLEVVEELNKESQQWEALEAKIEADFEAIRSRDSNVHVVPTHCGWFSWTRIHPLEEQGLPSFFNGKSQNRTPDMYMEIRNWIMKKFHANPNIQIELKDLSELEVGCVDDKQEVLEFLDYWGLVNFHPFPPESTATNADGDRVANADVDMAANIDDGGAAKKDSLLENLYHFDEIQLCPRVAPKPKVISPAAPSGLFLESAIAEELVKPEGPGVEYHCNSCSADCSRKRYHCQKQVVFFPPYGL
ncbi:SWI/SNF complex subunit SWI3D-like [Pistacia vera]|uniref:SWI/SNF complex subunit SWI3D-like n=1 Tax=Pistacia vera TaxID=55513 RepID=UPI001263D0E2|nr:SWI/SNF complex subunit SWI3D-like [Pistacia vera]